MIRHILFLFSICSFISLMAQKEVTLSKVNLTKSVNITQPLMVDSTNLKGEVFQNKNFLETFVSDSEGSANVEELSVNTLDYFSLSKPQNGARLHILSFKFSSGKYGKVNLKVIAPSMFEVYVDGDKKLSKTTIEDSLSQSKFSIVSFSPIPATTYNVQIKYLSLSTNKAPENIKIALEYDNKNASPEYTILKQDQKRFITIQDILIGKRITSATISPNGQYVLFNYGTTKSDGKTMNEIELLNIKSNKRITLTSHISYKWTPLSNRLYYTEDLDGKIYLKTVDPETLESKSSVGDIPKGDFVFSPDESFLIFTDKDEASANKSDLIRLKSPEDRQRGYEDRYYLSIYSLQTGVKQRLTYGSHSTYLNDISKDSRYMLYATYEEVNERPFRQGSMFRLDLQTHQVDTLWVKDGYTNSAIFSPDGKQILILGSAESFGGIGQKIKEGQIANSFHVSAFMMNLSTKQVTPISKDFDPSIKSVTWNSGDNVYFSVIDKSFERVYSYNVSNKKYTLLSLNEDVVRSFSVSEDNNLGVYNGVSINNSTKAYVFDCKKGISNLIADPSGKRLSEINFGETKDYKFVASDETEIDGMYFLPPNFDSTKKYPLIVYYYGGTLPTSRMLESSYPLHVYAAQGYVVYVVQPSGAIGYGQEFAARHVNAWGKQTADEIIEGTKKFISEHSFVDETKVGCIGASYGGFMTQYLQTQTDLFAAAVSHAGISALSSYWGEGYWGYTYSAIASANSYPWNNKELYVNQSPLFNADKINTPLLLLHGADDTNVPIGESIQMYTALKILGKPVEFIQVKGENHGIRDYKKRIEWNYTIYAWFAKWLKNDDSWWNSMYPN